MSSSTLNLKPSLLFQQFRFATAINNIKYENGISPALLLVGTDLPDVLKWDMSGKKLLLLVNGISAKDKERYKKLFYEDLKPSSIDKETSTITFDDSKLQVNVQDLESTSDPIALRDITSIFSTTKTVWCLYNGISGDVKLEELGTAPRGIRDVEGDQAIANVCSVTLHRRERGSTIIRSFKNPQYKENLDITMTTNDLTGEMEIREWGWGSGNASGKS